MANNLDAYIPELWANESVAILVENMVVSQLVHRDFSNQVASFGDIVNTRQPAEFEAQRKGKTDDVTVQDANATNIAVALNQHIHTSFTIKDEDLSKSFKQLVAEYLQPAVLSIAQKIDLILLGQVYHFLANSTGTIGTIASDTDAQKKSRILNTRKIMNINKAHNERNLILTPTTEAELLKLDLFTSADQVGDMGTALREASLGRKLQFNMFMCQNTPSITGAATEATPSTALVDNAGGYAIGSTTIHMDTAGASLKAGHWITFGDDPTPHRITATANLSTQDVDITITPPLRAAVADDDTCTVFAEGEVNLAAGYAAGWYKEIVVDGFSNQAAQVGQAVTLGGVVYTIIDVTLSSGSTIGITLDRPLEVAVADNDDVFLGPNGEYNFAFNKNCLAMVNRPLAATPPGLGANSAVANYNGIGIRVTMTYEGRGQGILVTVDTLFGTKVLDTDLGAVMVG